MERVTIEHRRNELASLHRAMREHPEREWSKERRRAAVLRQMLGRHQTLDA